MLHDWFGLYAVIALFALASLLAVGLRFSIVVDPGRVVIRRKWFGIPYWTHTADGIEDVFYGGNYGDADDAVGVEVVFEGGREFHIGSSRSMHHLYASLLTRKRHFHDGARAQAPDDGCC